MISLQTEWRAATFDNLERDRVTDDFDMHFEVVERKLSVLEGNYG